MSVYQESDYLRALTEMNAQGYNEKKWLEDHIELYLSTVIWPKGLPPISRSNLIKGTLREKFHTTYETVLAAHK
jgi:hypothetical protein